MKVVKLPVAVGVAPPADEFAPEPVAVAEVEVR